MSLGRGVATQDQCFPETVLRLIEKTRQYEKSILNLSRTTYTCWCLCCLSFLIFNNLHQVSRLRAIFPSTCLSCLPGPGTSACPVRESWLPCVYWGVSRFRFGWLVGGQLFGISHLAYFVPCLPQIRVPLTEPHYVSQNPCVSRCPTMCPTTRGFSNMIHGLDKRQATASFSTEWHPTLNLHFSVVEFHWVSLLHCWCHTQGVVWLIWRSVRMSLGICPSAKSNLRSIAFQT